MKSYTITHTSETTFPGATITTTEIITGAAIKMEFREGSKTGTVAKTLDDNTGITIISAYVCEIDSQIIELTPDTYYSDIRFTLADNTVHVPLEIKWIITQNVTQ